MDWGWWMGDMSERITRMIRETVNVNRETSGKGEKGKIRVNRGKEGEQNKRERRERPDGMVQYRFVCRTRKER